MVNFQTSISQSIDNSTINNSYLTGGDFLINSSGGQYASATVKLLSERIYDSTKSFEKSNEEMSNYPKVETTLAETGVLTTIGNVSNVGTWIDNYRNENLTFDEGRGLFSIEGDISTAPWKAYDIGTNDNGNKTFRGILFFDNNTTGRFITLANSVWIYIITPWSDQPTIKMWRWN